MSNIRGGEVSLWCGEVDEHDQQEKERSGSTSQQQQPNSAKKKRNLAVPGTGTGTRTPGPAAEVVALSPATLTATNRFICEICNKGFQRDQNLQLHRRGHGLPWKLKQRTNEEVRKRVYICPEPTCVHHDPTRALSDLGGIKKHYSRKHGEKTWKCEKCTKRYAVQSDWKAHQKTCGTREYKCDCGIIFSRKDSFITHRAFCDALAEENSKVSHGKMCSSSPNLQAQMTDIMSTVPVSTNVNGSNGLAEFSNTINSTPQQPCPVQFKSMNTMSGPGIMFSSSSGTIFGSPQIINSSASGLQLSSDSGPSGYNCNQHIQNMDQVFGSTHVTATALLQRAAEMGTTASNSMNSLMTRETLVSSTASPYRPRAEPIINVHSYDYVRAQAKAQNEQCSTFNGGFETHLFDSGVSAASNMVVYHSDRNMGGGFVKSLVEVIKDNDQGSGLLQRMNNSDVMARTPMRLGEGNDTMTFDFLGTGGSRPQNMRNPRLDL